MNVDFLLDPNIAYLILVITMMATMMAVISPGTGVLEIFTLFMWLISGYIIYSVPVNYWALGLLLVGVVLFLLSLIVLVGSGCLLWYGYRNWLGQGTRGPHGPFPSGGR